MLLLVFLDPLGMIQVIPVKGSEYFHDARFGSVIHEVISQATARRRHILVGTGH